MNRKPDRAFGKKLRDEIEYWEKEGLISPIQKDRILAQYHTTPRPGGAGVGGNLAPTFYLLGATLAGTGIVLFVWANWSGIPLWGKFLVMFVPMVASYGIGYYLRNARGDFPKVGASFLLLGSILFGAGIFLVAQLFDFPLHLPLPHAPLIWGLGVLPLAYLFRFKALLFLSLLALLFWLGVEAKVLWADQPFTFSPFSLLDRKLTCLYLMAGVALWGIGLMHRGSSGFRKISGAHMVLGMSATLIPGFLLTFDIYGERLGGWQLWLFYLVIAGIFFLSVIGRWLSREQEIGWGLETIFLVILMGLALYLSLFFPGIPGGSHKDLTLASNVIFLLAILIVLFLGYLREYPVYINMGILLFILDLGVRYYEFCWESLPRFLFFMIGGSTLLGGGALLERARRKILASFRIEEDG